MSLLGITDRPYLVEVDTPPIGRPVALSNNPRSTWPTGVMLQTGARTVLVLSSSSTSRRGRPTTAVGRCTQTDHHSGQPHPRPQPDRHRRGCHSGVGREIGGCYPLAPPICPPSLSFFTSSTVRKGNKEGGRT